VVVVIEHLAECGFGLVSADGGMVDEAPWLEYSSGEIR